MERRQRVGHSNARGPCCFPQPLDGGEADRRGTGDDGCLSCHPPAGSLSIWPGGEGAERAERAPCWGAAAVGAGTPGAAGSLYQNHLRCQRSQAPSSPPPCSSGYDETPKTHFLKTLVSPQPSAGYKRAQPFWKPHSGGDLWAGGAGSLYWGRMVSGPHPTSMQPLPARAGSGPWGRLPGEREGHTGSSPSGRAGPC